MEVHRSQSAETYQGGSGNSGKGRVAVAVANYNTAEHLSHLLFSLFRVLRRGDLGRVVVVDNGSGDLSRPILHDLAEAGLVEAIFNTHQRYHGPSLNQAIDHLAARVQLGTGSEDQLRYVWVLDSDTVVLRASAVLDAIEAIQESGAGLLGQFQYDALQDGYAHPSSILVDLQQTFLAGIGRFDTSGAPALELHLALRACGIPISNFPFRAEGYVVHLARRTLRALHERGEHWNRHYATAVDTGDQPEFHGDAHLAQPYREFLKLFKAEVPKLSPDRIREACLRADQLEVPLMCSRNLTASPAKNTSAEIQ